MNIGSSGQWSVSSCQYCKAAGFLLALATDIIQPNDADELAHPAAIAESITPVTSRTRSVFATRRKLPGLDLVPRWAHDE